MFSPSKVFRYTGSCHLMHDNELCIVYLFTGVLAVMWPCGTIVLLAELFRAESKSQVYAIVHELLTKHTNLLDNLSPL